MRKLTADANKEIADKRLEFDKITFAAEQEDKKRRVDLEERRMDLEKKKSKNDFMLAMALVGKSMEEINSYLTFFE